MRTGWLVATVAVALGATTLPATSEPAAPAPVRSFFYIPAADGTPLRACAIAPPGALESGAPRRPVILEWTSYAIDANFGGYFPSGCPPQFGVLADAAAHDGYIYVAANTRGTGASGGNTQDFWDLPDAHDGAHVVEWLARQRWSTGHVGIVGCSNSGAFANGVAAVAPAHLDAVVTDCAPLDPYRDTFYPGGLAAYSLLFTSTRPVASQVTPQGIREQARRRDSSFVPRPVLSSRIQAQAISNTADTEFWRSRDLTAHAPFRAPTYYLGSWADYMLRGTTEYARLAKASDRILITPGEHGAAYGSLTGRYGLVERALGWFDHWLRGAPDPFQDEPRVLWWQLDGGSSPISPGASSSVDLPTAGFLGADAWPPPQVRYRAWYLRAGTSGTAHSLLDRSLTTTAPRGGQRGDRYVYPGASGATFADQHQPGGDSVPDEGSDNGVIPTYTSPPLRTDLRIAGPVALSLWATTTAPDTDWVVRLVDVAPDGTARDVTMGWLKSTMRRLDPARTLRDGQGRVVRPYHPSLRAESTPINTPVRYEIEVEPTATVFHAGHRIRVVIGSTAAPWYLQTIPPAVNTVLHDSTHPSRLLLPVLP